MDYETKVTLVPLWHKSTLSLEEAIEISLGMKPLRGWCNEV